MIHGIPGVKKTECNAEQKIAYNYAFTYGDGHKGEDAQNIFPYIQRDLARRMNNELKKYDVDIIYTYILRNLQRYVDKPFIATSYSQIGKFFT